MKFILFLLAVSLLGLLLISVGGEEKMSQEKAGGVFTICPQGPPTCDFSKISEAIQAAESNYSLRIGPGTYQENLLIDKNLQIAATEAGKVRIQGVRPGWPTIILQMRGELRVSLDGLVILGGQAAQTARDCFNENLCIPWGIALDGEGSILFVLSNSEVTRTIICPRGVGSPGKAQLIFLNSRISDGAWGIRLDVCKFREILLKLDQVDIAGSHGPGISLNRIGALRGEPNRVTIEIENSRFVGNGVGLEAYLLENSHIAIRNSWFVNNPSAGARIKWSGRDPSQSFRRKCLGTTGRKRGI